MRVHILKAWPEPFQAVLAGTKRHEVRKNDRAFAVGDYLCLEEWEPYPTAYHAEDDSGWCQPRSAEAGDYTFQEPLWVRVTYMTPGGSWGLPADVCVMSIEKCEEPTP